MFSVFIFAFCNGAEPEINRGAIRPLGALYSGMLDCDYPEESESFNGGLDEPMAVQGDEGSWGWGAFFGGAVGWMLGRSERPNVSFPSSVHADGDYTPEEKEFLSQIWRYEKEMREVWEKKHWRKLYCLVLLSAESFKQTWRKFIPGNPGYSPSPKFDREIRQTLPPFVDLIREAAALEYDVLLPETEKSDGKLNSVYLDYETMKITVDDVPFSTLYPEPPAEVKP